MNVFALLLVILFVAFLVEALTEYIFGMAMNNIPTLTPFKWTIPYVAMVVGVVGALIYKFDLIYLLSQFAGAGLPMHPFGIVLTGIGIGRGSNFIHDIWQKFFVKP